MSGAWESIPEVRKWLLHPGALMATRQLRGGGGRQAFSQDSGPTVALFTVSSVRHPLHPWYPHWCQTGAGISWWAMTQQKGMKVLVTKGMKVLVTKGTQGL